MSRACVLEIPRRNHLQPPWTVNLLSTALYHHPSDLIAIARRRTGQDGAGSIPAERQETGKGLRAEEQRLV